MTAIKSPKTNQVLESEDTSRDGKADGSYRSPLCLTGHAERWPTDAGLPTVGRGDMVQAANILSIGYAWMRQQKRRMEKQLSICAELYGYIWVVIWQYLHIMASISLTFCAPLETNFYVAYSQFFVI